MALARTFNKINGLEWGKIISRDIEQHLSRDDAYRQHVNYLEAGHEIRIITRTVAAPGEPEQVTETIITGGRTMYAMVNGEAVPVVGPEVPRERVEVVLSRRHSSITEPPDQLRKDQGLYIPQPQLDPATGTIVDIPREEITREQLEQQDNRRAAVRERDEEVKARNIRIPRYEAQPVEELARDVDSTPLAEVRHDIARADRIKTELPPEHVVVEEQT